MAAISKRLLHLHLHLRPSSHSFTRPYPYTHRHFSSSSDHDDSPKPETPPPPPTAAEDRPQPPRSTFSFPSGAPSRTPPPSGDGSVSDHSQRLANFRSKSAAPPPPSSGEKHISLQELYEKNRKAKGESYGAPPSGLRGGGSVKVDAIRESLSSLGSPVAPNAGGKSGDSLSLSRFADSRMKAGPNGVFGAGIGGSIPHFRGKGKVGDDALKSAFQKEQELLETGRKLQALRPEKRKGKWFSLQEFSNRVAKLKMVELKQREVNQRLPFAVSDCLLQLTKDSELKDKQRPYQVTVGVLGSMGSASLVEKLGPPQDHLYEQYFHPDLMSSAEKLKLELAKVRDEFKMSESDCGSARVQVAQLTTKIKHLSAALHKKDKHSRRGLLAMVQRRKKLLKYLRRTDWDSYCFLLSKLGLRDNPDIKAEAPVLR